MPPSGGSRIMDDEALIEAEIAHELDHIVLDDEVDLNSDNELEEENQGGEEDLPAEFAEYLKVIQKQTRDFEQELEECDELMQHSEKTPLKECGEHLSEEDKLRLETLAKEYGEEPEEFRKRILEELSRNAVLPLDEEIPGDTAEPVYVPEGNSIAQLEEVGSSVDATSSSLTPENASLVLVDEAQLELQKFLREQTMEMNRRYTVREEKLKKDAESKLAVESQLLLEADHKQRQRLQKMEKDLQHLAQEQKVQQLKLDMEVKEKEQEVQLSLKKYEEEIHQLEAETRKEQEELDQAMKEEQHRHEARRQTSALTIQAFFRGYRVRQNFKIELQRRRDETRKRQEEQHLQEVEEMIQKRNEEIRQEELKMEEERQRNEAEERKKIEEERRKQEEKKKKKEEDERKKKAEEEQKRKLEEEMERKKKEDEQKRKQEEKERKKKEEEEIKRKKEEDKRKKEELEKRQKEEEMRKVEEEKLRQEQEKKKQEEFELKQKEEAELERKRIEEIERKRAEEKKQKEEEEREKKRQEEEMKRKEERDRRQKEEDAKERVLKSDRNVVKAGNDVEQIKQNLIGQNCVGGGNISEYLPPNLDQQRLAWIKDCIPWSKVSNEPWKLKVSRKPVRRPASAKKAEPLAEHFITAAAQVATLRQVTTVELCDLPGCSVSTLGQCWGLKCLSMNNCNLVAIEGLQTCKQLQYLDLKNNYIEYVDLKDMGSIQFLDLSHNKLTSIHGLDGCTNLRWLKMDHNRITRIGGMDSLRRLHTLILSHNQIINSKGLCETPTVQALDVSHNHLQRLDDTDKLCLLQKLDASANNLLEFPHLCNHVLLQVLCLEDNSITSLNKLSSIWLPLLHQLKLGQNSISEMSSLENCIILKELDLSNNQLMDPAQIFSAIMHCKCLNELRVDGNPVEEEDPNLRHKCTEALPCLQNWNGEKVRSTSDSGSPLKPRNTFEGMCLNQVLVFKDLQQRFDQDLRNIQKKQKLDLLNLSDVYFRFCDKTFKATVEQRYAHEYGEIIVATPSAPQTPKSGRPKSARTVKTLPREDVYMSPKEMFEMALRGSASNDVSRSLVNESQSLSKEKTVLNNAENSVDDDGFTRVKKVETSVGANVVAKLLHTELVNGNHPHNFSREHAATKIQALWRGFCVRKMIGNVGENIQSGASQFQSNIADFDVQIFEELQNAATTIQAAWRGYNLRCKLSAALDYARFEDDGDDFDLGEVDLNEFEFDEDLMEKDWRPPDTPQLPAQHALLGKPPSGRLRPPQVPRLNMTDGLEPPSHPVRAWRNVDSPMSDAQNVSGRLPRPPSSVLTGSDTHRTATSKKEDKLSEEWGFKDSQTAHLMMQRAKKMKYNAEKRKKLNKLDPKQRLALFRKLEETTQKPVHVQQRKTLPRKEYFQARQQEIEQQARQHQADQQTRVSRTFEWLHTQVGAFEVTDSRINQVSAHRTGSETSLPHLDPEVTAGGRAYLTGSPVSMDLQSVNSGSFAAGDGAKSRRFSTGDGSRTPEGRTKLPPIKTGSAPTGRTKEKMSWRSAPVEQSVGWGGGKKRQAYK